MGSNTVDDLTRTYLLFLKLFCFLLLLCFKSYFGETNISFAFRDRGSKDDCIGTAFINLSAIAGQGDSSEGKYNVVVLRYHKVSPLMCIEYFAQCVVQFVL